MADTIGDFLTIIRNASRAGKADCTAPFAKLQHGLAEILKAEGFIRDIEVYEVRPGIKRMKLRLKYVDEVPVLRGIRRESKPGCRLYFQYSEIPRVLGGLGIAILTTSKGLLKDTDARREKIGGELVCTVW